MKFLIAYASRDEYSGVKEFNSLTDLLNFQNKVKNPIIIAHNMWYKTKPNEDIRKEYTEAEYTITVYDDYIE